MVGARGNEHIGSKMAWQACLIVFLAVIASIPVQVFFDKTGKEFFRHVGFFPQTEVEKKILEMGGLIDEKSS